MLAGIVIGAVGTLVILSIAVFIDEAFFGGIEKRRK